MPYFADFTDRFFGKLQLNYCPSDERTDMQTLTWQNQEKEQMFPNIRLIKFRYCVHRGFFVFYVHTYFVLEMCWEKRVVPKGFDFINCLYYIMSITKSSTNNYARFFILSHLFGGYYVIILHWFSTGCSNLNHENTLTPKGHIFLIKSKLKLLSQIHTNSNTLHNIFIILNTNVHCIMRLGHLVVMITTVKSVISFTFTTTGTSRTPLYTTRNSSPSLLFMGENGNSDLNDIVAARIIIEGDVNGGYYRSCVKNEVCLMATICILWFSEHSMPCQFIQCMKSLGRSVPRINRHHEPTRLRI